MHTHTDHTKYHWSQHDPPTTRPGLRPAPGPPGPARRPPKPSHHQQSRSENTYSVGIGSSKASPRCLLLTSPSCYLQPGTFSVTRVRGSGYLRRGLGPSDSISVSLLLLSDHPWTETACPPSWRYGRQRDTAAAAAAVLTCHRQRTADQFREYLLSNLPTPSPSARSAVSGTSPSVALSSSQLSSRQPPAQQPSAQQPSAVRRQQPSRHQPSAAVRRQQAGRRSAVVAGHLQVMPLDVPAPGVLDEPPFALLEGQLATGRGFERTYRLPCEGRWRPAAAASRTPGRGRRRRRRRRGLRPALGRIGPRPPEGWRSSGPRSSSALRRHIGGDVRKGGRRNNQWCCHAATTYRSVNDIPNLQLMLSDKTQHGGVPTIT